MQVNVPRREGEWFLIQNQDLEWTAGVTADRKQVLMGQLDEDKIVGVFFDLDGNLIELQKRRLEQSGDKSGGTVDTIAAWQSEIGFQRQTIEVRRFDRLEQGIGISDRPMHYEEFLKCPARVGPDEFLRARTLDDIAEWDREARFVLVWGQEYWMNRDGSVYAT